MTLRIIKANEPITVEQLTLCIYGQPGLGKTTLAFTTQNPLLLDFDKGAYRAGNRGDAVPVDSWADVTSITHDDLLGYKTVVIDTAGRALDVLTQDIIAHNPKLGRGGALTLQGFGELKSKFAAWLKMLHAIGKDVVLVAHMDEQRSGDDTMERLDVQGSSKGEIYKSSDAMGRIVIQNKLRYIDFSPRENAFGKNPCQLELIPFLEASKDAQTLAKVMLTIKERLNKQTEEQKKAQEEMKAWEQALTEYETTDDFNGTLAEVKQKPKPMRVMFNRRAKELGFVFNEDTKLYEAAAHVAG